MLGGLSMVRLVAAMAATVGSLALLAGPAQAYDRGNCDRAFGAANVVDVDYIRKDNGTVDFGDILHLGGAPQGNAVVCWTAMGGVAVIGRVFADTHNTGMVATATINYYENGDPGTPQYHSVSSPGYIVADKKIGEYIPSGAYNRVRIRLGSTDPNQTAIVFNKYRGD
jgi:hypothetical protein